jgi:hypothetical protein
MFGGASEPKTVEEVIAECDDVPVDQSLERVVRSLCERDVLVPLKEIPKDETQPIFRTNVDKSGNYWIYMYTNEETIMKSFPGGLPIAKMSFEDLFRTALSNHPKFAGIAVIAAPHDMYPIPDCFYPHVARYLGIELLDDE